MKIKDVAVGGRFLARLMLGADVYVHAEYLRGTSAKHRPGYFECKLLSVEVLENGLSVMQKQIAGPDQGLVMNGEVEIFHEELSHGKTG